MKRQKFLGSKDIEQLLGSVQLYPAQRGHVENGEACEGGLALDIAYACTLTALARTVVRLALDEAESLDLRAAAPESWPRLEPTTTGGSSSH